MARFQTVQTNTASGLSGLNLEGKQGRFESINGVYEPMQQKHNDKPCWCARSVQSTYIFHTGKARWVVSKRLDDGTKCFAFIKDTGAPTPDKIEGETWACPDADGEWRTDPNIACTAVPAANDKFVQLRMSLDNELTQLGLVSLDSLKQLWKRLDYNGNNIVSLAEIDKMVVELVEAGTWPSWLNNKPALMRAYKKTILKDGNGDDWVQKGEFHALLLNIFWFNKLWLVFDQIDTGDDRRMDVNEFCQGMSRLGLNFSQQEAQEEFRKIDQNNGGQVLFVEFCAYIRTRVNPDCKANLDADIMSGEGRHAHHHHHAAHSRDLQLGPDGGYAPPHHPGHVCKHLRRSLGNAATHTHAVTQKSLSKFDDLEKKFKGMCKDISKLRAVWNSLDFNGNNIVSLAEIDKLCVESYPILNHKPALMRAYKATIRAGNGDDWVQKKEFKCLLGNLITFNKIFWLFDHSDADKDRRLTEKEFKWCMACLGEKMSEAQASMEFRKIDRNGGGIILFDEFCLYVTQKKCPECMSEFLD